MKHKLRMTPDQVLNEAARAVAHARNYTADVEFSPEDASRSDFDFMCTVLQAAVDSGATTLNIPDTVGYAIPEEWAELLRRIRGRVTGDYVISTHCHNDLGLAVANSLAAVNAGARQVECTINGIGERAGNASLEEVVMILRTREKSLGLHTNVDTTRLADVSALVAQETGIPVQPNKAIVGGNAFAHASGIHQDGVLKDKLNYEIMRPEDVGMGESRIVLSPRSGRHAFQFRLAELGYHLPEAAFARAWDQFLELADRKKDILDRDLDEIVRTTQVVA